MSSKNVFIVLMICLVLLVSGFFIFVYNPKETDRELIQKKLQTTVNKFNSAKHAEHDLENIRGILASENEKLDNIKSRFINKNQLSDITLKMREVTRHHNLDLIDFTPVFQQYLADTSHAQLKTLPFSVTVKGDYIAIGKFVENWEKLSFYMIPDEIHIEKTNEKSNLVEADITGRMYAWSKGYE